MNLAVPIGLGAAALAVPLVVWYLLRSRRPAVRVASTYLWGHTDRSVTAAVPWQRFRPDATFWLVLLAILAGAVALARPFVTVPAELGDHTILIVDASASMLADEEGPTRLELARREADELVARMSPGQEISVVEASSRARVLLSASSDPAAIRRALRAVRPTHGAADLVDAFTLAAALQRPAQSTVLHLLTDGAVPTEAQAAVPEELVVTAVGIDRPNLAVTRLSAVPLGAGTNQALVQVRNLGQLGADAVLTLSVDGIDVVEETVHLAPRGTEDRVLTVPAGDGEILRARVEPVGTDVTGVAVGDALGLDDQAFAVLAAPRELTVMIAGPGNVFLEAAFAAVPGVTVQTSPVVPTNLLEVDLLVVDRVAAPGAPTLPTLYVAPAEPPAGVVASGEVELPPVTFQDPAHELLADVDLSEIAIAAATSYDAAALAQVVGGPDGALVQAGRLDGAPVVLVGFDLLQSNLPLLTAWPVFVANAVSWLAGPPATAPAIAGSTVALPADAPGADGDGAITVAPPSGDPVSVDPLRPQLLVDQVGVWRIEGGSDAAPAAIAVNAEPTEADLSRARPDPVEARAEADVVRSGAAEGRRSFAPWLVLAVAVLAAAEWLWVHVGRRWRSRHGGSGRERGPVRRGRFGRGRGAEPADAAGGAA
ncbi:MAG: BatA and WFA domain-containing protein [Actinobacteria bacterium]|nr:BatA and WFA domain-containing protein [Actinomycetota bacterium]